MSKKKGLDILFFIWIAFVCLTIGVYLGRWTVKYDNEHEHDMPPKERVLTVEQDMLSGMLRTYVWCDGEIVKSWMLANARPEQIPIKRAQAIKWAQDIKKHQLDSIIIVRRGWRETKPVSKTTIK